MSEKPGHVEIGVGDLVKIPEGLHPDETHVVTNVEPPTVGRVETGDLGETIIDPTSSTTLQAPVQKLNETMHPEHVAEALITGFEAKGFRPRTPEEQQQLREGIADQHAKGPAFHPEHEV